MIDEIHLQYPFMGSRRIRTELAKKGHSINRKRVVRIMHDMGIGAIYPNTKTTLANKAHKAYPCLLRDIEVTYPNQAWAIDITYILMAKGFLYLTREIAFDFAKRTQKLFCQTFQVEKSPLDGVGKSVIAF